MGILSAVLAVLSCTLIGAGIWLVVRDTRQRQARQARAPRQGLEAGQLSSESHPAAITLTPHTDADEAPQSRRPRIEQGLHGDLAAAVRAVNGAFAPAGIALMPSIDAPAGEGAEEPLLRLALMAGERLAGQLSIVSAGGILEITAASEAPAPDALGRRRDVALEDASIPSLAEAIAACAWPVATAVASRS